MYRRSMQNYASELNFILDNVKCLFEAVRVLTVHICSGTHNSTTTNMYIKLSLITFYKDKRIIALFLLKVNPKLF